MLRTFGDGIYVIAGEKALPLRVGMNRHHWSLLLCGEGLGDLRASPRSSDAARPRPYRDNRTISDLPTEFRRSPVGIGRVPTQNKQVPPNPPTHARSPEETTGLAVSRIGVTATWHGLHLVGVRTLNSQRSRPLCGSGGGNPRPSGRGGCQWGSSGAKPACRTAGSITMITVPVYWYDRTPSCGRHRNDS